MDLSTIDFTKYTQWSGYITIGFLLLTIIAFIARWGFRFRLFGATAFMGVLTAGIFALNLGLFTRTKIPGAARYSLVYDNGANKAVVAVSPDTEISSIEPTLRQAAADLYSYGRTGNVFTISLRSILHPSPGISQPLYLGIAKKELLNRSEENLKVELFEDNLALFSRQSPKTINE